MQSMNPKPYFYPALESTLRKLESLPIRDERKKILSPLIEEIKNNWERGQAAKLHFICTHNSRRSQLAQIWACTAAAWYGIPVEAYSGGVEVTAFNAGAVSALKRAGFKISSSGAENPVYWVFFASGPPPVKAWSKLFDDPVNPKTGFTAVMTCSDADENCPYIPGAGSRIPLWYEDPKIYDGTVEETLRYDERSDQIGAEMVWVFSKVGTRGLKAKG